MPWFRHADGTAVLDYPYRRPGKSGTGTVATHHTHKTDIPYDQTSRVAREWGRWAQQWEGSLTVRRTSDLIAHFRADHPDAHGLDTFLAGLDRGMGSIRMDRRWAERWAVYLARLRATPFKAHGWLTARLRSPGTIGKYTATMRRVLRYAVATGWLDKMPIQQWEVAKGRERGRVLGAEEERRLLNALARDWLYWPVRFALRNPIRRGDLFALTTEQYDPTVPWVRFYPTKTRRTQTRPTCLPCIDADLAQYLASRPAGALLFPKPGASFARHWRTICRTAQVQDFRFHDLRHCATKYMLDLGYTTDELRRLQVHGTAQMVARYDMADQREVVLKRSRIVASGKAAAA